MEFLFDYGLFLAKVVTAVIAVVAVVAIIVGAGQKNKQLADKGYLDITPLNKQFTEMSEAMLLATTDKALQKQVQKQLKKEKKHRAKVDKKSIQDNADSETQLTPKPRVFVLNFKGNISASAVTHLREEISAVLTQANSDDEVLIRLESSGGMVHSYGLASSQLDRLRKQQIPITVCVDKVAASGGYMMACVADKILAAPFAIVGSVGVVAQIPNFNKLLKKHNVDYEVHTAGEHKRTLTVFGENTEKGREKFIEDLEQTHQLFKEYVSERRPDVDINKIATGEVWYGTRAQKMALVDQIQTSDEYLMSRIEEAEVYEVAYVLKKSLQQRLGIAAEQSADRLLLRWWHRLTSDSNRHF